MLSEGTSKGMLLEFLLLLNAPHTGKPDLLGLAGRHKVSLLLFLHHDIFFEILKHLKPLMTFM